MAPKSPINRHFSPFLLRFCCAGDRLPSIASDYHGEGLMSVRKRTWKTAEGEQSAWLVTYSTHERDDRGKRVRRFATFATQKEAEAWLAEVTVDVSKGVYVPASKSPTVAEAGKLWLAACEADGLERTSIDSY